MARKAKSNKGLSEKLLEFSHVYPVARPEVKNQMIEDPNLLAGFTTGEGCFFLITKSPTHYTGFKNLRFSLYPDSTCKG